MKNAWIGLVALTMALGLTACGGKPSSGNAKQALVTLLQQSGTGQVTDVQNFELTGCVEAQGADGYRYDTRGQVVLEIAGRQVPVPVNKNLRYAKADGAWRAYAK
ncbi:starvation-inducible outer membrane lipoprotein [Xanthomonas arboricola]